MPPQGDLIQLSPSCNGRYINHKGGSSRHRCQPFLLKNSSTGPTGQLTGSIARVKHQDSKTPHLEEYSFLVAGALALAMVSWTSAGKPSITALGPVWAIPTASRALAKDARSCPEAGTVSLAWSESPKEADTREELAPRTRSGRARMGLWEGDGRRSPSLCIVLPESALLAETRTDWHSAMGGRTHLCPESSGNSGRTRAGTGLTLEKQRGPPPLCQTDPRSGIPSDGSTSIPPAWASVSTENRPPGSVLPERELAIKERNLSWDQRRRWRASLSRVRDLELPWRFMWDTTAILSVLTMIWYPPRTGRKYFKARKTAVSSRQFICQKRNSSFHAPLAGLPSKTAPQPVIDASVVIIWRRWIAPILTPLWRKTGSRHIKKVSTATARHPDKASSWYNGV